MSRIYFLTLAFVILQSNELPSTTDQVNTNQEINLHPKDQNLQDLDTSASQKKPNPFFYTADFGFFFDNLEESSPFWDTRTLIAAQLMPAVGLKFFGQNIRAGGFLTLNMGERYPKQWGGGGSYSHMTLVPKIFLDILESFPKNTKLESIR